MDLKSIFVDETTNEGLYAIRYDGETLDEFERLLDLWSNTKYVQEYFIQNRKYLETNHFKNIFIGAATSKVLEEAYELEKLVYNYAESGFEKKGHNLQMLFLPLGKQDRIPIHQLTKAKIESRKFPRFIRLYAIRIGQNTFVISGGAIKLTKRMEEHKDTKQELEKFELVKSFLREKEIKTEDDINYFL